MPAEITIPLEVLARLPPRVLRQLAEAAEIRERRREQLTPDFTDCVKALFVQQKLPPEPPPDGEKQAEWRRVFVAAIGECYRRRLMGQHRAAAAGVPGLLVAVTKKGTARR